MTNRPQAKETDKMKVSIVNITQKKAVEMLKSNTMNRSINKPQLNMIKRAMIDGRWRLTHQGIAIYKNGDIADGQHRLTAIAETGISCKMTLFKELDYDKDTVLAIDCGKARTVKDSAEIAGHKIKTSDGSLAKAFEFGYSQQFPKLNHAEIYDLIIKHKSLIDNVASLFSKSFKGVTIVTVKTAASEMLGANPDRHDEIKSFCNTLITGEYSEPIMANAVKLRNKLLSDRYTCGEMRLKSYLMTVSALEKTLSNKKIKVIK